MMALILASLVASTTGIALVIVIGKAVGRSSYAEDVLVGAFLATLFTLSILVIFG